MIITVSRPEFTMPCNVEVDNSWIISLAVVPKGRNHLELSLREGGKAPLVSTG